MATSNTALTPEAALDRLTVVPDDESAGEPFTCLGGCGRTLPPSEAAWEVADDHLSTCLECADRLAGELRSAFTSDGRRAEPERGPRFVAGRHFGQITVRDRETGLVVVHAAPWDEDMARFVAAELNEQSRRVALFTWEALAG